MTFIDDASDVEKDHLIKEVRLLSTLKPHPNVLGVIGYRLEPGKCSIY